MGGQIFVQLFSVITGFLLLRWLPLEDQAKYSLGYSVQMLISVLTDAGFGGSILSLVGVRIHDRELIAQYMSAVRFYRDRFFVFAAILGLVILMFAGGAHNWSLGSRISIISAIFVTVLIQSSLTYYRAPLQMHNKMGDYYFPQIVTAVARLAVIAGLYFAGWLTVSLLLWTYNLMLLYNLYYYRIKTRQFYTNASQAPSHIKKEVLDYVKPLLPIILFNAFYGQISIFLISFFGNVSSVAQIGALSRFGQIFVVFTTFDMVMVTPFTARAPFNTLLQRYLLVAVSALGLVFLILTTVFVFPDLFLWALGPRYQDLGFPMKLYFVGLCIGFLDTTLYAMNISRKWIFKFNAPIYIIGLLTLQILFIRFLDLSEINNVIWASIYSNFFLLLAQIYTSYVGWRREARLQKEIAKSS